MALASDSSAPHSSTPMLISSQPSTPSTSPPADLEAPLWTQVSLGLSGCLMLLWSFLMLRRLFHRWKAPISPGELPPPEDVYNLPCPRCRFLHGNVHLPCAVNPVAALTPAAKDCLDFDPDPELEFDP